MSNQCTSSTVHTTVLAMPVASPVWEQLRDSLCSVPWCVSANGLAGRSFYFWWINPRLKIGSYFQDDSDGNEVVPVGVNGPGDPFTGRAWEQYGGDGATPTLDLYSQITNLGR